MPIPGVALALALLARPAPRVGRMLWEGLRPVHAPPPAGPPSKTSKIIQNIAYLNVRSFSLTHAELDSLTKRDLLHAALLSHRSCMPSLCGRVRACYSTGYV